MQTTNGTGRDETKRLTLYQIFTSRIKAQNTVYTNRQRVPGDTMTGRENSMSDNSGASAVTVGRARL